MIIKPIPYYINFIMTLFLVSVQCLWDVAIVIDVMYRAFLSDIMAAMLGYSQQKNLDSFFCLELQRGHYTMSPRIV